MELMRVVGLTPEMAPGAALSGGQQQRVAWPPGARGRPPVLLMDEPFSAVPTPVVRESLQDHCSSCAEWCTGRIVFVTHDMDEAVELGDPVAVLRSAASWPGTTSPACCSPGLPTTSINCSSGATEAIRGLSFRSSERLPLHEVRTTRSGERTERGWSLVVDADGRPVGWHHYRAGGGTADGGDLVPGGSLYDAGTGSLRSALDAALSSPSGQGVAVDGDGRVVGAVIADDVLDALATARRAEAA